MIKKIQTYFDPELVLLEAGVFRDHRGYFVETYSKRDYEAIGLTYDFVQDNVSMSELPGTLRGLHYQLEPIAQTKLVRVTKGAAFDVAVDIRQGSPTYGRYAAVTLTDSSGRIFVVPKGFAHGVCTLVPNTEISYKVDNFYSAEASKTILWNDPEISIMWPYSKPILSEADKHAPLMEKAENNFRFSMK